MRILFILLVIFNFTCISQNVTIKGKAHASHIGKEIVLSDYSDYVTFTKTKESIDTIDKDGYFELKIQTQNTKPILISINNLVGKIYIQPNFVYGIYFPPIDSTFNNQEGTESNANISVYGKDSTELNALIIDFNQQYNSYFAKAAKRYLSPSKLNALLDTFLLATRKRYKFAKNNYFKNYLEYSFASFFSNTSHSRAYLQKQYIDNKPILYANYEYMEFFDTFFKGYFKSFSSTKTGGSIFNSINSFADYNDLRNQFISDKTISNDTIKELVLLKELIDCYYSPDFEKQKVQSVIEQLYTETTFPDNKKIAHNMLQSIYQLQAGAIAPDFIANDKNDLPINLSSYKGKYIYLNFFSTLSDISLKEMQKIVDLKKKFNDKVTFISVCLDDSAKTYKQYLKLNPKYDWVILHQYKNSNAKQAYKIASQSGYFFINQKMQLLQSPALAPSEGIEYKFYALFRPKRKNTITGIR